MDLICANIEDCKISKITTDGTKIYSDNQGNVTVSSNSDKNKTNDSNLDQIQKFENNLDRSKRRNFFTIAKENASNRLFERLKLSPEDLNNFFEIEQDEMGNGVATRDEYEWIYSTKGEFDIIPLNGYIRQPTKYHNGKRVPVVFKVSHFFQKDREFIQRCKDYFKNYNIDFRIIKLKTPFLFKIIYKVVDPDNIVVRAE